METGLSDTTGLGFEDNLFVEPSLSDDLGAIGGDALLVESLFGVVIGSLFFSGSFRLPDEINGEGLSLDVEPVLTKESLGALSEAFVSSLSADLLLSTLTTGLSSFPGVFSCGFSSFTTSFSSGFFGLSSFFSSWCLSSTWFRTDSSTCFFSVEAFSSNSDLVFSAASSLWGLGSTTAAGGCSSLSIFAVSDSAFSPEIDDVLFADPDLAASSFSFSSSSFISFTGAFASAPTGSSDFLGLGMGLETGVGLGDVDTGLGDVGLGDEALGESGDMAGDWLGDGRLLDGDVGRTRGLGDTFSEVGREDRKAGLRGAVGLFGSGLSFTSCKDGIRDSSGLI